ncbi:hypothetical protein [Chloroflexus islandicus]|uniref:hypothetical protein n=1 Tax=Chloroflexus islandicus TaxID=1707952 RepID=UPI000AEB4919|nr:hypothetical protein [Chloroflexus islandicus]
MSTLEGWAFLALMACLVGSVFALTLFEGSAAIIVSVIATLLGILSGGLYAASVKRQR